MLLHSILVFNNIIKIGGGNNTPTPINEVLFCCCLVVLWIHFKKRNTLYLKVAYGNYFSRALSALNSAKLKINVEKEARFSFNKYAHTLSVSMKGSGIHNLHMQTFLVETISYPY